MQRFRFSVNRSLKIHNRYAVQQENLLHYRREASPVKDTCWQVKRAGPATPFGRKGYLLPRNDVRFTYDKNDKGETT